MKIAIIIGLIPIGCLFGYFFYKWNAKRDEKRLAEIMASWGEDKKYRVKYRPVWKDSDEDAEMVITFEPVMAPDKDKADFLASTYLNYRSRSLSFETVEITEIPEE